MLAQFSIWPLDQPHMSKDLAKITQELDRSGVRYELGPMATTVEGEWQDVMAAIRACHEKLRANHQRVLTTITIDDDASRTQNMSDTVAKVVEQPEQAKS